VSIPTKRSRVLSACLTAAAGVGLIMVSSTPAIAHDRTSHRSEAALAEPARSRAACLDNAVYGAVVGGPSNAYLPSPTGTYRTTNRCNDINFTNRSASGDEDFQALIRVCFVGAGYCQSAWKYYDSSEWPDWMVIASNVRDNTTFRLEFQFFESNYGSRYENLIAF
jgi:hypothetical protein